MFGYVITCRNANGYFGTVSDGEFGSYAEAFDAMRDQWQAMEDETRYVVVMIGWTGSEYRTPCTTEHEAEELLAHHESLGFEAWIEMEGDSCEPIDYEIFEG